LRYELFQALKPLRQALSAEAYAEMIPLVGIHGAGEKQNTFRIRQLVAE
jgi:hypothetical protein